MTFDAPLRQWQMLPVCVHARTIECQSFRPPSLSVMETMEFLLRPPPTPTLT